MSGGMRPDCLALDFMPGVRARTNRRAGRAVGVDDAGEMIALTVLMFLASVTAYGVPA